MNIYVGNLPHATTDDELREAFEEFGSVSSATVIKDKFTGRSRGFGFVEMADRAEAEDAIASLNGRDFGGRTLTVNEARPREERPRREGGERSSGGGGYGNRGGGGGGGGYGGGGGGGYGQKRRGDYGGGGGRRDY
jgi:RNA recognition motif-containing protein